MPELEHEHNHEHEHHHEHEHEHNHEHEHHHEHEHTHHHHHHHHDDECCSHDHGHEEHDHDHGHQYEVPGYDIVETHSHEGASICSFEKRVVGDKEKTAERMQKCIEALRDLLNERGCIIGHLKGYIREEGEVITFSTVGAELNTALMPAYGAMALAFASIVFGIEEEALKDEVLKIFSDIG